LSTGNPAAFHSGNAAFRLRALQGTCAAFLCAVGVYDGRAERPQGPLDEGQFLAPVFQITAIMDRAPQVSRSGEQR
jgi:hypothetical protein